MIIVLKNVLIITKINTRIQTKIYVDISFYNAFDHGLKDGWVRVFFVEYKILYRVKDPIVRWGGFKEKVHGGVQVYEAYEVKIKGKISDVFWL